MMTLDRLLVRRHALKTQLDAGRAEYDKLETTLRALDRQLCAMAGGLQELESLIDEAQLSTAEEDEAE